MALSVSACGGDESHSVDAPPIVASYIFDFPSHVTAIAAQNAQVFVFAVAEGTNPCSQLLYDRKTHSQGTPFASGPLLTPCDLYSGAARGEIELPFGNYAFVGVAQRDNEDLMVGCGVYRIDTQNTSANINLVLASHLLTLPPTTCTSLSDWCAKTCQ